MHDVALTLVLFSALLHATWNAQLKGNHDRAQFMANMCLVIGVIASVCTLFAPLPSHASWGCIGISALLHILYNLLLLENYRRADFSSSYPIARGISPLLVTTGAFLLMHQRPTRIAIAGVAIVSAGIVSMSLGAASAKVKDARYATLSTLATGVVIAAYTVVDGMGVQRSTSTLSYTLWVFASYLGMLPVLWLLRFPVRVLHRPTLPRAASAGLFSLAAYTVVLWATRYAEVGVVSALRETSVLWAVLIGRLFLKESLTWRRVASAVMICVGVSLLVI